MGFLNALGMGLQGLNQGLDEGSRLGLAAGQAAINFTNALNQQRQLARQNFMQNFQLAQQMAPGLISTNPGQAAQMITGLQQQGRSLGFPMPNSTFVGAPKTVESPLAPGQMGPGLPMRVNSLDNPQTKAAMAATLGLTPQVQVLGGSYGTPPQAISIDPITHQIKPVWQGQVSPLINAETTSVNNGTGRWGTPLPAHIIKLANGVGYDTSTGRTITVPMTAAGAAQPSYSVTKLGNGNIGLVDRRTGQITDTGKQGYQAPRAQAVKPFNESAAWQTAKDRFPDPTGAEKLTGVVPPSVQQQRQTYVDQQRAQYESQQRQASGQPSALQGLVQLMEADKAAREKAAGR